MGTGFDSSLLQKLMTHDLIVNPGSLRTSPLSQRNSVRSCTDNPYLKYIKKVRNLSLKQGNKRQLSQKAEKITSTIIQDFLVWYKALGGAPSDTGIDRGTLEKLFRIGFDAPTRRKSSKKHRPELKDPTDIVGRRMIRNYRPSVHFVKGKEEECDAKTDLETMATVWKGIENLRSTIAFSNWLKDNIEVQPPSYLQTIGLLDVDYFDLLSKFNEFKTLETENSPLRGTLLFSTPITTSANDAEFSKKKIRRPCRRVDN